MWIKDFVDCLESATLEQPRLEEAIALKQAHLPKRIYKYRRDSEYSRENLKTDTVWIASPDAYNDPYDCSFTNDLLEFFDIWLSEAENPEERKNLFENTLGSVVCHYKHDGFSEEREWRLVVSDESPLTDLHCDFRCSASMLIPYKVVRLLGRAIPARSLDQIITEVIIGPGPHMELNQRSIRMYFDQVGLEGIPVRCSSIPYRDW